MDLDQKESSRAYTDTIFAARWGCHQHLQSLQQREHSSACVNIKHFIHNLYHKHRPRFGKQYNIHKNCTECWYVRCFSTSGTESNAMRYRWMSRPVTRSTGFIVALFSVALRDVCSDLPSFADRQAFRILTGIRF